MAKAFVYAVNDGVKLEITKWHFPSFSPETDIDLKFEDMIDIVGMKTSRCYNVKNGIIRNNFSACYQTNNEEEKRKIISGINKFGIVLNGKPVEIKT